MGRLTRNVQCSALEIATCRNVRGGSVGERQSPARDVSRIIHFELGARTDLEVDEVASERGGLVGGKEGSRSIPVAQRKETEVELTGGRRLAGCARERDVTQEYSVATDGEITAECLVGRRYVRRGSICSREISGQTDIRS